MASTKQKTPDTATQLYLQIAEIKDDVLVMKDGSVRAILRCEPVNLQLKNEDEQKAIIISYQGFLNSLDFPIQILIQSRKLDIDHYIDDLKKLTEDQTNDLLKKQSEDYITFVEKLVEVADIMEKEFYVVIPYEKEGNIVKDSFIGKFWKRINPTDSESKYEERLRQFDYMKKTIDSRASIVSSSLTNAGLSNKRLTSKEIVELFYKTYNPGTSQVEKFENINLDEFLVG